MYKEFFDAVWLCVNSYIPIRTYQFYRCCFFPRARMLFFKYCSKYKSVARNIQLNVILRWLYIIFECVRVEEEPHATWYISTVNQTVFFELCGLVKMLAARSVWVRLLGCDGFVWIMYENWVNRTRWRAGRIYYNNRECDLLIDCACVVLLPDLLAFLSCRRVRDILLFKCECVCVSARLCGIKIISHAIHARMEHRECAREEVD